jgi:hypothetical protein
MSIYKTRLFSRWARRQGVLDSALSQAVREIRAGLCEADLGGNLVKKRIARPGQGKSGGFRTLVTTRDGERCFFLYGFAKNEQGNMDDEEVAVLKDLAKTLLEMSPEALLGAERAGELMKVDDDA